jgi:serine/threonine-protein kinase
MDGSAAASGSWPQFPAGATIAGYLLQDRIGQGGMAVVFRALDERLQRTVALKILAPSLASDESFRLRFIRESQSAAAVDHPNIIPVFGAGEEDGVLYLAMRYVPTGDAKKLVTAIGPLPVAQVSMIVASVAAALDAAHAAGLVHRDVKPSNMLIGIKADQADHVYLADFGLAKDMASAGITLTATDQFLGTVDYVAPEQIQGGTVDARTDQYALACSAYELLSGRPPFRRDTGLAVLNAHLSDKAPPLATRRLGLPPGVDEVLARGLAKESRFRYRSCGEFAAALAAALDPRHQVSRSQRARRSRRGVLIAAAAAVAAVSGAAVAIMLQNHPAVSQARQSGGRNGIASGSRSASSTAKRPTQSATGQSTAQLPGPGAWTIARSIRNAGGGARQVDSVAFSGDGATLATGDKRGGAYVWSAASGRRISELPLGGSRLFSVALSPDGSLAVTATGTGDAYLYQAATGAMITQLANPGARTADWVTFSPAGDAIAIADGNGDTYVWRVSGTGAALTRTISDPAGTGVWAAAFSPDGKELATTDFTGNAYLWNLAGGGTAPSQSFTVPGGQSVTAAAFTPDGKVLATGNMDGTTYLWNLATGTHTVITDPGTVWGLAISKDNLLAIGDSDGSTYLWDLRTGTQVATLRNPGSGSQGVGAVAFSPDGETLAAGDSNGTTYLWEHSG